MSSSEARYREVHRLPVKGGGNAFPIVCTIEEEDVCETRRKMVVSIDPGMTRRDYFAARAPDNIPEWFEPRLTSLPVRPKEWQYCEGCKADTNCEGNAQCGLINEHNAKVNKVKAMRCKETYFQWRWHYADMMIETGKENR